MILLDTHVLIWADINHDKLGRKARARIEQLWPRGEVAVPSISFWEVGRLHARRRLRLAAPLREWRDSLLAAGVVELPLDGDVAVRSLDVTGLHEDPADRFIVATALVHGAALMTADDRLLDWQHTLQRFDARV